MPRKCCSAPLWCPASAWRRNIWGVAVSNRSQTCEEHCLEIAEQVRELAWRTHIPQVREELCDLAEFLDRMGTEWEEEQES